MYMPSKDQADAVTRFIAGEEIADIADALNVRYRDVDNALRSSLNKVKLQPDIEKAAKAALILHLIAEYNQARYLDGLHFPRYKVDPNLDEFKKRECRLPGVDYEWIKQHGDSDGGRFGVVAYHLGEKDSLMVEFTQ